MENKVERKYSFYRTRRSRNAWRFVCSGRIRRHFSQNEVCHKGRVSGLNDPLMHVWRNYWVRGGKVSKGQGRNLTPSISLLRVLSALSASLPFHRGPRPADLFHKGSHSVQLWDNGSFCTASCRVALGCTRVTIRCTILSRLIRSTYAAKQVKTSHNYLWVLKVTQRINMAVSCFIHWESLQNKCNRKPIWATFTAKFYTGVNISVILKCKFQNSLPWRNLKNTYVVKNVRFHIFCVSVITHPILCGW